VSSYPRPVRYIQVLAWDQGGLCPQAMPGRERKGPAVLWAQMEVRLSGVKVPHQHTWVVSTGSRKSGHCVFAPFFLLSRTRDLALAACP
jgi:hypothetical protein